MNVRLLLQPLPAAVLLFSHQPLQLALWRLIWRTSDFTAAVAAAVRQLRLHTSAPHDADTVSQSVIYLLAVQQWNSCCIYTHAAAHRSCDNGHCCIPSGLHSDVFVCWWDVSPHPHATSHPFFFLSLSFYSAAISRKSHHASLYLVFFCGF